MPLPWQLTHKSRSDRAVVIQIKQTLYRPLLIALAATVGAVIFVFNVLPGWFGTSTLQDILDQGELVVLTRNSPTTYYEGPQGPAGLEYDLTKLFADELGVKLKVITAQNVTQVLAGVENGVAHFAAAGLTITEDRKQFFHFGPPYQEITEQLVYSIDAARPNSLDELSGTIEVVAFSSHNERLLKLKQLHPELNWHINDELESEDLMQLVEDNVVEYTIVDSNEFALSKRFMLSLRAAFDISPPQQLGWLFPLGEDDSLRERVQAFFTSIEANGELKRLISRNYSHTNAFDYVDTIIFHRHVAQRLPVLQKLFEAAAQKNNLDWRLLAAMGYQESHWDPDAVSPTGVRGIMMLTQETASELGIENRTDPEHSIMGGADYFARTLARIPADITEPDRTRMALAAYNVGMGHLEDARIIAQQLGKDPHRWFDVKQSLPLLAKRKWYKQSKHGYARGWEPLQYVENIRSYYDLLRQLDESLTEKVPEPDEFSKLPRVP
jgi:membrane-bound lytic murein transglycosylase F